MKKLHQAKDLFLHHSFLSGILLSLCSGFILSLGMYVLGLMHLTMLSNPFGAESITELLAELIGLFFWIIFSSAIFIYPPVLTLSEILFLILIPRQAEYQKKTRLVDMTTIFLGVVYSYLYLGVGESVVFSADWPVTLVNAQKHTPIYTGSVPTLIVIMLIAALGYLIVNFIPLHKMPPLLLVLGLAAMYLGTLESIVFTVQTFLFDDPFDLFLLLLPFNCILITARTVIVKSREWKLFACTFPPHKISRVPVLTRANALLQNSDSWPLVAFLLMWPLLGILIAVLLLFGQSPDAVIKAFTETSGWNLSQRVSPQNIYYDEHYLCTVAAGGHKKIVKPLRLGVRHGHEVIVNRQLCVANAFEQILEERTPRLHRAIRKFYDTYGFPVARLIKSRYIADMIYYLMKPLEWIFLSVLYLTEAHPEDRIALQYTGKSLKDFK